MAKVECRSLTSCGASNDGESIHLDFIDAEGRDVSVQFPFHHAAAVSMTLPQLLSQALKRSQGDEGACFVYHLDKWSVEHARHDAGTHILTLSTTDGFKVSFAMSGLTSRTLGRAMVQADSVTARETGAPHPAVVLN